jgi:pimeloyl-ACP methyl ester carboxylesterase
VRRTVQIPGGNFHYLEAGERDMPLVVCLHGFPDHPMGFEGLMGVLAEAGYRAVAPWMRGYAPSPTDGPFDIERLTQDCLELIDALSPDEPVILVGHDWGAAVAYSASHEAPDRVRCAITLAWPHTAAFLRNARRTPAQLVRSRYMAFFQLRRISDKVIWKDDFAYIDRLWKKWSPRYTMPTVYRTRLKNCLAASMPAPLRYYRDILRWKSLKRFAQTINERIEIPVLHLHGSDDGCITVDMADGQDRYFGEHFESRVVANAGHFVHLDAPEKTATLILSFLRRWGIPKPAAKAS